MNNHLQPHKFPVGTKVKLTGPFIWRTGIIDEPESTRLGRPVIIDTTEIEITGTFYVVKCTQDTDGTPTYVLCSYNDPVNYSQLKYNLYNVEEDGVEAAPINKPPDRWEQQDPTRPIFMLTNPTQYPEGIVQ